MAQSRLFGVEWGLFLGIPQFTSPPRWSRGRFLCSVGLDSEHSTVPAAWGHMAGEAGDGYRVGGVTHGREDEARCQGPEYREATGR